MNAKDFCWLSGEEFVASYNSSENVIKTFCSVCGSNLISLYRDRPDILGIPLGGLDQDPGIRPIANIFVSSKSPWYDINDGLPQYLTWPEAMEAVIDPNYNQDIKT